MRTPTRNTVFGWLAVLVLLGAWGCDGNPGPNGSDAPDFDHQPPEVVLVQPNRSTVLYGDTLTLVATAHDSGGAVDHVTFYVNGHDSLGTTPAVDSDPPYTFLWDFAASETPYGLVSFMAEAWDTAGNRQSSPLVLLRRERIEGIDTLAYYDTNGDDYAYSATDSLPLFDANGDSIGNVYQDAVGEMFTPRGNGALLSCGYYLVRVTGFSLPQQAWLTLSTVLETADSVALTPLDSVQVAVNQAQYDQWTDVDLRGLNGGNGLELQGGTRYALSLHPVQQGRLIRMFLRMRIQTGPVADPGSERFLSHLQGLGWQVLSEYDPGHAGYYPWMYLVVDYGSPVGE